jgi:hypothetical protein
MQTTNNLKHLVDLGLADYETLAQNFIESIPPAELISIRGILERAVNARLDALRGTVRARHCLTPTHWLLEHGDRKLVAKCVGDRKWRVYEAKFSKGGVLSKGRVITTLTVLSGINSVKWEFLLGRI